MEKVIQLLIYLNGFAKNIFFLIIIGLIILIYNVFMHFFKDRGFSRAVLKNIDPKINSLEELKDFPLLNIIVPAWKEGILFKDCLSSISKLKYPNIKVIVNAGGSEETINIANEFKKFKNFIILLQSGGKEKAALGKIKALNECLIHVSEGLLYLTDADCYITDDLILRLINPLINGNEDIVIGAGTRPLISQEKHHIVKYALFSRFGFFKTKYTKYHKTMVSGANTCLKYEVIESIGKFNEDRIIAEDVSRGYDILSKGFKVFWLSDYGSRIYTDYPITIKETLKQRKRYIENFLMYGYFQKNLMRIIKVILLFLSSIFLIIFPIFVFINLGLFFICILTFAGIYFNRIRRYIFFKIVVDRKYYHKFPKIIFIKMFFYIYLEILANVATLFGLYSFRKQVKNRI